ncbi:MAG: ATP-binding protein [Gammaproteobacteria bacterium]
MTELSFIKPRTILQLLITGFALVSGILLIALTIAINQLDQISRQSQAAVSRSLTAMAASRVLLQQSGAMERNARQYAIVGEKEILGIYEERRRAFLAATDSLERLALSPALLSQATIIRNLEADAYTAIQSGDKISLETAFEQILEAATNLSTIVSNWSNMQIDTIARETSESQRLIAMQLLFLIAAAISLASVFVLLITRPLKQVATAIEQLGSGSYSTDISIGGPKDLVAIGQQLDWLRERLSHLDQQRTLFLRHVSHELKSPLAAIQESAALLEDGVVGELSTPQKELINIQVKSLQKLHNLIDELLRQHQRQYAVVSEFSQDIRLDKLIGRVLADHDYAIGTSAIDVSLNLEECCISGNREQLRVLLDNVIANAIRFSPEGGSLAIEMFQEENLFVILVKDEGPGIPDSEQEKIFEAFYQSRQQTTGVFKGSGLGLAIAREYAAAHNGAIKASNSDPRGACFRITLPAIGPGITVSGALPKTGKMNLVDYSPDL